METVDVPVDDSGLQVDALAASGARAVLCTPAHQYPCGVALSPARREQLLRWADKSGGLIIEDDYDAEFRYERAPLGCLQGMDSEHVALLGSVSKTLARALESDGCLRRRCCLARYASSNGTTTSAAIPSPSMCWPTCSSRGSTTGTYAGSDAGTGNDGTPFSRPWVVGCPTGR